MRGVSRLIFFWLRVFSSLGFSVSSWSVEGDSWAVLVCTSKYFFNYRHLSNVLSMYRVLRKAGVPDSRIILMSSLEVQCDSRNRYPGQVYDTDQVIPYMRGEVYGNEENSTSVTVPRSLCDGGVEMDYTGEDVNMETMMSVLTGRHPANTPMSKRLNSNSNSNVLFFISGHGGDEFMKFQDYDEISAPDIAHGIYEMQLKKRYGSMLFVVDTCQASTLGTKISSPNVISLSSSRKDENSYAFHSNTKLGLSVIDRFSYKMVEYLESRMDKFGRKSNFKSLEDLYRYLHPQFLHSTAVVDISPGTQFATNKFPLKPFFRDKINITYFPGEVESIYENGTCDVSDDDYNDNSSHSGLTRGHSIHKNWLIRPKTEPTKYNVKYSPIIEFAIEPVGTVFDRDDIPWYDIFAHILPHLGISTGIALSCILCF